ncbi:MAG: helix-turn-helix domain-containing protein [Actinomycetota bacterium]|nr:helix-turn-helix domain-containing protein [Actinomycetota bacterium]
MRWDTTRRSSPPTSTECTRRFHDPSFGPDDIAYELHVSRRQLYRYFAATGESPATAIADRRLAEVRTLLLDRPDLRLSEIAGRAGFSSTSTMRNRFRAAFGVTPTEFRSEVPGAPPSDHAGPGEVVEF